MKTPTQKRKKKKHLFLFHSLSLLTLAGVFHAWLTDGKWRKDIENDGANCCLKAQPDVKLAASCSAQEEIEEKNARPRPRPRPIYVVVTKSSREILYLRPQPGWKIYTSVSVGWRPDVCTVYIICKSATSLI